MLAKRLSYSLEIAAPASAVWARLTDFASYPSWNPFVPEARGVLRVGETIMVKLRLLGPVPLTLHPRVTRVDPERELRWLAQWGVPGIFDVDRGFQIEALGATRCRFVQEEICSGVLAPALLAMSEAAILRGYEALARALREQCAPSDAQAPAAPSRFAALGGIDTLLDQAGLALGGLPRNDY